MDRYNPAIHPSDPSFLLTEGNFAAQIKGITTPYTTPAALAASLHVIIDLAGFSDHERALLFAVPAHTPAHVRVVLRGLHDAQAEQYAQLTGPGGSFEKALQMRKQQQRKWRQKKKGTSWKALDGSDGSDDGLADAPWSVVALQLAMCWYGLPVPPLAMHPQDVIDGTLVFDGNRDDEDDDVDMGIADEDDEDDEDDVDDVDETLSFGSGVGRIDAAANPLQFLDGRQHRRGHPGIRPTDQRLRGGTSPSWARLYAERLKGVPVVPGVLGDFGVKASSPLVRLYGYQGTVTFGLDNRGSLIDAVVRLVGPQRQVHFAVFEGSTTRTKTTLPDVTEHNYYMAELHRLFGPSSSGTAAEDRVLFVYAGPADEALLSPRVWEPPRMQSANAKSVVLRCVAEDQDPQDGPVAYLRMPANAAQLATNQYQAWLIVVARILTPGAGLAALARDTTGVVPACHFGLSGDDGGTTPGGLTCMPATWQILAQTATAVVATTAFAATTPVANDQVACTVRPLDGDQLLVHLPGVADKTTTGSGMGSWTTSADHTLRLSDFRARLIDPIHANLARMPHTLSPVAVDIWPDGRFWDVAVWQVRGYMPFDLANSDSLAFGGAGRWPFDYDNRVQLPVIASMRPVFDTYSAEVVGTGDENGAAWPKLSFFFALDGHVASFWQKMCSVSGGAGNGPAEASTAENVAGLLEDGIVLWQQPPEDVQTLPRFLLLPDAGDDDWATICSQLVVPKVWVTQAAKECRLGDVDYGTDCWGFHNEYDNLEPLRHHLDVCNVSQASVSDEHNKESGKEDDDVNNSTSDGQHPEIDSDEDFIDKDVLDLHNKFEAVSSRWTWTQDEYEEDDHDSTGAGRAPVYGVNLAAMHGYGILPHSSRRQNCQLPSLATYGDAIDYIDPDVTMDMADDVSASDNVLAPTEVAHLKQTLRDLLHLALRRVIKCPEPTCGIIIRSTGTTSSSRGGGGGGGDDGDGDRGSTDHLLWSHIQEAHLNDAAVARTHAQCLFCHCTFDRSATLEDKAAHLAHAHFEILSVGLELARADLATEEAQRIGTAVNPSKEVEKEPGLEPVQETEQGPVTGKSPVLSPLISPAPSRELELVVEPVGPVTETEPKPHETTPVIHPKQPTKARRRRKTGERDGIYRPSTNEDEDEDGDSGNNDSNEQGRRKRRKMRSKSREKDGTYRPRKDDVDTAHSDADEQATGDRTVVKLSELEELVGAVQTGKGNVKRPLDDSKGSLAKRQKMDTDSARNDTETETTRPKKRAEAAVMPKQVLRRSTRVCKPVMRL